MNKDRVTSSFWSTSIFAAGESFNGGAGPAWKTEDSTESKDTRIRILVVDDQKLIVDTLVEILGNVGFEAAAAYNGWEALEVASRFHPDWLVSDVLMPTMNGVELAIAIRQIHPKTTILLFSGQAGISEILEEGHQKGYEFELIPKPIHPLKLIDRIKQG
jgi:CheY-like chemotaxis protein